MKNPIVTEEELKSLKLFSYYVQSHGIKSGNIDVTIQDCEINWISELYGDDGGRTEMYAAIEEVITNILERNEIFNYLDDCDNYAVARINIDCIEKTLEIELSETVRGSNEMSDSKEFDELDKSMITSLEKMFEESDSPTFEVAFYGGGDSGDIESRTSNGVDVDRNIENLLYKWLESFYGGWEINEGSQGRFIFEYENKIIYLEFEENTEENEERDIDFQIKF